MSKFRAYKEVRLGGLYYHRERKGVLLRTEEYGICSSLSEAMSTLDRESARWVVDDVRNQNLSVWTVPTFAKDEINDKDPGQVCYREYAVVAPHCEFYHHNYMIDEIFDEY